MSWIGYHAGIRYQTRCQTLTQDLVQQYRRRSGDIQGIGGTHHRQPYLNIATSQPQVAQAILLRANDDRRRTRHVNIREQLVRMRGCRQYRHPVLLQPSEGVRRIRLDHRKRKQSPRTCTDDIRIVQIRLWIAQDQRIDASRVGTPKHRAQIPRLLDLLGNKIEHRTIIDRQLVQPTMTLGTNTQQPLGPVAIRHLHKRFLADTVQTCATGTQRAYQSLLVLPLKPLRAHIQLLNRIIATHRTNQRTITLDQYLLSQITIATISPLRHLLHNRILNTRQYFRAI